MESEENTPDTPTVKVNLTEEVKNFYKGDFKEIFVTFLSNPIDGIYSIFKNPSPKAYIHSIILFASVLILYLVGGYLLAGENRRYIEFATFFKISLIPVIMMFIITFLSFIIKSSSGKANFKNELLTGGFCGIPLGLLIPVFITVKLITSEDNIWRLVQNPISGGTVGLILLFYILLMLINIFQQSLKASGTKDSTAWYLSPVSILLAIYVTYKISSSLF